jgi:hypothetical protein
MSKVYNACTLYSKLCIQTYTVPIPISIIDPAPKPKVSKNSQQRYDHQH